MRKFVIVVALLLTMFGFCSCVDATFYGTTGVVTKVERLKGQRYKYQVTINHSSSKWNHYIFWTNELYNVSDTISISKK